MISKKCLTSTKNKNLKTADFENFFVIPVRFPGNHERLFYDCKNSDKSYMT